MTDRPQPRKHLAKRWWGKNGLTIRCTCGQWQSTSGTRREQDDAHRNHRQVMGEVPKDRKPTMVERLEAEVRRLTAELDAETAQKLRIAQQAVAEEARLRAELERVRQQTADRIAAEIRQHCPDHGDADTCRIDCHCAIADELTRPAAVSGA